MNERKLFQNGITLIALVISIIVMLILAGVSLNATIGDNGIITQAQNATIVQSCADLQDFLNQTYINDELDELNSTNSDGTEKSPVEKIFDNYSDWFYINGANNFVIQEYSYTNSDGTTETGFIKLRLIRKKNLPDDIRKQLKVGNATGRSGLEDRQDAYDQLKDVFGVTGDLQVFYCSDGIGSIQGANFASSASKDAYDGTKTIYNSNSSVAKAIAETNGTDVKDLNMQDLRQVQELNISDNFGITSLEFLYDLPNVTKLNFKNYTGSLNGIERAYRLKKVYFENNGNQNIDYTNFSKATGITELYVYNPTDSEIEKMIAEMSKSDYSNLATLGIYGYMSSESSNIAIVEDINARTAFTRADLLQNLTANTKNAINVLYINNNSIENLNLTGFTNLSKVRANCNKIKTMSINTTKSLQIALNNNELTSLDFIPSNLNISYICLTSSGCKDLSSLTSKNLKISNLVDIDYPLTYLDEIGETRTNLLTFINSISAVTINPKYNLLLTNNADIVIDSNTSDNDFKALKGNQSVKRLYVSNNKKISNDTFQDVLSTLPNLTDLRIRNTNLTSLNFISKDGTFTQNILNTNGCVNLRNLDIVNDNISDLSILNNSKCKIISLWYNEYFNLVDYQNLTTRLFSGSGFNAEGGYFSTSGGLCSTSGDTYKTLENCTFLTVLMNYGTMPVEENITIDLSNLSKLTNFYIMYVGNMKFILPPSVTTISRIDSTGSHDFSKCTNLTSLYLTYGTWNLKFPEEALNANVEYYTNTVNNMKGIKRLNSIKIGYSVPWCTFTEISKENETVLPETESVNDVTLTCINSKKVLQWVNETQINNSLTIQKSKLYQIPTLKAGSKIKSLVLNENVISSVYGIEKYTDLETLNLSNNMLSNYFTYTENGKAITKNTCEVIANLPKLKLVYLRDNVDLNDFSALEKAGFTKISEGVYKKSN